jgi:hypothetical protein
VRCRDIVRAEFERRRRTNPRYSLRRFAQALGVHHSTLSRQLRGRRALPSRVVRDLGARLHLSPRDVTQLVERETTAAVAAAIGVQPFTPDSRHLAVISGVPLDDVNIALTAMLRDGRLTMPSAREWVLAPGEHR